MSADRVNVVVVGGGVIGCCTAYYLARAGAQVTLLERHSLCSESSSAAAGLASVSNKGGLLLALVQESLRLMRQAAREFDVDFQLIPRGSLILLRREEEVSQQQAFVEKQRQAGMDIHLLDRQQALELEPHVSSHILGAVYSPVDCGVNPYALTVAYGRAARGLGASIRTGVEVTALRTEGGRVRAAVTADGEVAGDILVVAAGAWTPLLTRTVGLDLPIEPSRGQILITQPVPAITRTIVRDTGHIYVNPTDRGNYALGSMTEKVGFNKELTPQKLREYLGEAAELVPSLSDVRITRAWAGLRPLTADSQPFIGHVEGYEGLVVAAGHSRTGICFSAVTGKMVADLITSGDAGHPLDLFDLKRFSPAA